MGWNILKHLQVKNWDNRTNQSNTDILGINHNIDELLVGIFTQINLRQKKSSTGHSLNKVKLFINYKIILIYILIFSRLVIFLEIYSEIVVEILGNRVVI